MEAEGRLGELLSTCDVGGQAERCGNAGRRPAANGREAPEAHRRRCADHDVYSPFRNTLGRGYQRAGEPRVRPGDCRAPGGAPAEDEDGASYSLNGQSKYRRQSTSPMTVLPNVEVPTTFAYGTPAEVVFGNGSSRSAGERVAALGVQQVLLLVDKGVVNAGLSGPVEESLRAAGVRWDTFDDVAGEPTDRTVQAALDRTNECRPEAIVAMGGGSALDTAKAAAAIAANGGRVMEYLNRERRVERAGVPVVAIPTTAGTGSEVTPISVIIDVDRRFKGGMSGPLLMPRLAICDPELTRGLPPGVTSNSGLDALTHCVECYSNTVFNPYAKLLALEGVRVLGRHLRRAVAHGGDLATRWQTMWGANLGGLCIAKAGTGDVHAFAGPISGRFGVPHGRANAILLPYVMEFSLPGAVEAYADIAQALGEPVAGLSRLAAAERAVAAVRRLIADCGGPQRLAAFGVSEADVDSLTHDGFGRGARATNPRIATEADVAAIYRACL